MKQYISTVFVLLAIGLSTVFSQETNSTFLYFQSDDYNLDQSDQDIIRGLVDELEAHSSYSIDVIGHTDQDGHDDYNQQLAKKRANSTIEYLIGLGLPESRVYVNWKGEQELVSTDLTPSAKQKNRRVEYATSIMISLLWMTWLQLSRRRTIRSKIIV